jgi:hypothetical protein
MIKHLHLDKNEQICERCSNTGLEVKQIVERVSESSCCSCGELTGKDEVCRTIVHFSEVYETIPQKIIRDDICKIANCY